MSDISTSTVITQSDVAGRSWPITINGGATITFGSNLIFTTTSHYFIMGTNGVIIDGSGYTVDVSGVPNYPGLVRNGSNGVNGKSNTTIQNLGIRSIGSSTLATTQGWIGQQYYSNNASGNIIQNCYSTGVIGNNFCGGIVGQHAGQLSGGNILISNCYTTGEITNFAGGIFGKNAGYNYGTSTATNCYSTGAISGYSTGGIFGLSAGRINGTVSATNCYSIGAISGNGAGGIFAQDAGDDGGTAQATNCYTMGVITNNAGGIFGYADPGNLFATNCYVVGSPNINLDTYGNYTRGIFSSDPGKYAQSNCFVENNTQTWNSTNALATLTGQGSIWKTTDLPTDIFGQQSIRYRLINIPEPNTNNRIITQNQTFPLSYGYADACYNWPLTITGGSSTNPITINYMAPVVYTDASHYLILGSPYITVDGSGYTVSVTSVVNYPGLVQNGTSTTNGYSNTTIQNLGISTSGPATLATTQGWVGQRYYSNNASGNIIQNCYSTGDITNNNCGGIVGQYAATLSGGNISISNCYTKGEILGNYSGGIFGSDAGQSNGTVTATNCYTTGAISGNSSGGIFGYNAAQTNGTARATNCYTTGTITMNNNVGGIFGTMAAQGNNVFAANCYVVGSPNINLDACGNYTPGIFGSNPGKYDQSNCFVENNTFLWNSTNALATLTGQGSVWEISELLTDIFGQQSIRYTLINMPEPYIYIINNRIITQNQTFPLSYADACYNWPLTITGGSSTNPITIKYTVPVVYKDAYHYLILGSPYITVDGSGYTVDISGVVNYPGLVQNGTSTTNGYSNTTIQNLRVITSGSTTLAENGGWLGQQYYSSNASGNIIQNCYSTGAISNRRCGGIFGANSKGTATNCSSSGTLSNTWTGGIFGGQCFNSTANYCFSTGNITGFQAGGIFGLSNINNGTSTMSATNCYSTGNIIGQGCGGIYGICQLGGIYYATNCYSNGSITGANSGGIFGIHGDWPNLIAVNCYSSGTISGSNAGGILGLLYNYSEITQPSNCYIANGTWNSTLASATLTGVGTTVWNANFIPYQLTAFSPLPLTINIITGNNTVFDQNTINNDYSWPVALETSTETPTTIIFNGSIQLSSSSTKYFAVNGQTVSLVSGTGSSITNTDTTANSLFR